MHFIPRVTIPKRISHTNFLKLVKNISNLIELARTFCSKLGVLLTWWCLHILQKDEILKLIKYVEQSSANLVESAEGGASDSSHISSSSARERELEVQVLQLQ
ncbi:hypothetical protein LIER_13025 [Lithospermum erythrorhizon]|uniref:Uncharacterized protein n=1 Tax=Lithospermum erythrorhizon TaxID=34254 RepID=A0AAV3PVE3_LITER